MNSGPGCAGTTATTRGSGGAPIRIPTDTCALAGIPTKSMEDNKMDENKVVLMQFLIRLIHLLKQI